jgi:hypothetical protein
LRDERDEFAKMIQAAEARRRQRRLAMFDRPDAMGRG